MPPKPRPAALRITSTGKCFSSSQRAECGASSASAKALAMSSMARWSSEREKSNRKLRTRETYGLDGLRWDAHSVNRSQACDPGDDHGRPAHLRRAASRPVHGHL